MMLDVRLKVNGQRKQQAIQSVLLTTHFGLLLNICLNKNLIKFLLTFLQTDSRVTKVYYVLFLEVTVMKYLINVFFSLTMIKIICNSLLISKLLDLLKM